MVTTYSVTIAYCVEFGRDTLREADYGSPKRENESSKDEGNIEQRGDPHRRELFAWGYQ